MHGPGYILLWAVLLLILLAAGWRRRWWAFAVYAVGCTILLVEVNRGNGGWDDLADFATLIVFVLPLYLIGTIVWAAGHFVRKHRAKQK
ncbi:hypothetical protein [Paenibacillus glycinis]|uniref:Cardiolipin synthase N-terminal domain-containing protein n=1 Tax=Paenibacillus glycinis TaxID=2697035 RepID=A0ABW9XL55_9BACL|nr:hypothetical protein [Paenibacillus glycinis]NBD23283.1 hypothetical protein [Paenibacillus glycinis]